jgi:hypothetical protein
MSWTQRLAAVAVLFALALLVWLLFGGGEAWEPLVPAPGADAGAVRAGETLPAPHGGETGTDAGADAGARVALAGGERGSGAPSIELVVVAQESGAPLPEAEVRFLWGKPFVTVPWHPLEVGEFEGRASARGVNPDGAFALALEPEGDLFVVGRAPGRWGRKRLERAELETTQGALRLELAETRELVVQVLAAGGAPSAGIPIELTTGAAAAGSSGRARRAVRRARSAGRMRAPSSTTSPAPR